MNLRRRSAARERSPRRRRGKREKSPKKRRRGSNRSRRARVLTEKTMPHDLIHRWRHSRTAKDKTKNRLQLTTRVKTRVKKELKEKDPRRERTRRIRNE